MTWDELELSMQKFKATEMKKLKAMMRDYNTSLEQKREAHV